MKCALLSTLILGATTIAAPCYAQFSTSTDSCSNLCVKVDLGSLTDSSSSSSSFSSNSTSNTNGLRWQVGVVWRLTTPEVSSAESERVRRQLEDNRSLMIALTEAMAQNKPEMAHGLAILLAPRLGYKDPRKLLADLQEGSLNIGSAKLDIQRGSTPTTPASNTLAPSPPASNTPAPIDRKDGTTNVTPAPIQTPAPTAPSKIIELR
jgi:hypothetical protein